MIGSLRRRLEHGTAAKALIALTAMLTLGACTSVEVKEADWINSNGQRYEHFVLSQGSDLPRVEYYISKRVVGEAKAPIVLYIQGSGCAPVFPENGGPTDHFSTVFTLTTEAAAHPELAVMVVNKPYVPARVVPKSGTATNCPKEFNNYFDVDSWVGQIGIALRHARALPWIDTSKALVIGFSEGATIAASLAAREPGFTHVALVGGAGPDQYYDFVVKAYMKGEDDEKTSETLSQLTDQLADILRYPNDPSRFWLGHPYKRWASFFRTSTIRNLEASKARLYIVSGMDDMSTPVLSTEVIYSELAPMGKRIVMRRLPHADHGLFTKEGKARAAEAEYDRVIKWFLAADTGATE